MSSLRVLGITLMLMVYACGNQQEGPAAGGKDTTATTGNPKVNKTPKTLPDGEHKELYPDGKVKIIGEIVNGQRNGTWQAFYPTGTKQSETHYEDGKKNGKTATFYPSGRVRYVGYYKWDKETGIWEFYNEDGSLATTKEYK